MTIDRDIHGIDEAAHVWAIRVADPAFGDWDALTEWLERDPAHLAAYEAAQDAADWAADLIEAAPAPAWQPAVETPHRRQRWWIGAGAVAATMIAVVGGRALLDQGSPAQMIATAPGEHRTVDLGDGSRVVLNGGTRIAIDPDTPRHVELAQGEALFHIRHDASKPFVVVTGETRLLDAGTVFNVIAEGKRLDVAVSEGAVIYQPGNDEVRLDAGDVLSLDRKGAAVVRRGGAQSVGGWQSGSLQYDGASMDEVASDLARNLGRPVSAGDGMRALRFSGTLVLNGSPEQVLARAGPLLGVKFKRSGEGWTMSAADGP